MPPPYFKTPHGTHERFTIPMVHLIGVFKLRIYQLTQRIGILENVVYNVIPLIGNNQPAENVPIQSIILETEYLRLALTQEIISEETLKEVEKRLEEIIWKAEHLDTRELDEKIKILSKTIKDRYV
jgi:hypothetical protein